MHTKKQKKYRIKRLTSAARLTRHAAAPPASPAPYLHRSPHQPRHRAARFTRCPPCHTCATARLTRQDATPPASPWAFPAPYLCRPPPSRPPCAVCPPPASPATSLCRPSHLLQYPPPSPSRRPPPFAALPSLLSLASPASPHRCLRIFSAPPPFSRRRRVSFVAHSRHGLRSLAPSPMLTNGVTAAAAIITSTDLSSQIAKNIMLSFEWSLREMEPEEAVDN
ncbi:hypothetical protein DAI22_11g205800 [Oryza sativa Japonica Group]|nr:hypothetical protein DAI22_11g205800 [Oryza sativa Japonica Group]